jgi:hypothetical protein
MGKIGIKTPRWVINHSAVSRIGHNCWKLSQKSQAAQILTHVAVNGFNNDGANGGHHIAGNELPGL